MLVCIMSGVCCIFPKKCYYGVLLGLSSTATVHICLKSKIPINLRLNFCAHDYFIVGIRPLHVGINLIIKILNVNYSSIFINVKTTSPSACDPTSRAQSFILERTPRWLINPGASILPHTCGVNSRRSAAGHNLGH